MMHHALSLGETDNFQFIVRAIISELQNNSTSKCNAHKLLFTFLPNFGVFIETLSRFEFFSAFETVSKRCDLARDSSDLCISESYCLRRVHWSVLMLTYAKCSNDKLNFGTKINRIC